MKRSFNTNLIYFIDPQSYNNLSKYDSGVLSAVSGADVRFFGSTLWDCPPMPGVDMNLWFDYNTKKSSVRKALSYLRTLWGIARRARREKPAVVHIQWTRIPTADLLFVKYLRSLGIKVVYTAHNVLPHDSGDRYLGEFRKFYNTVDRIIVHTSRTRTEIETMFAVPDSKISVIPHGILNIEEDLTGVKKRMLDLRKHIGLDNKLVFASMGLQSFYKGVDNIVKLWSEDDRFRNNPKCHLLLIGKNRGVDYSTLAGISNVTVVDEKVDNLDFMSYMRLADVVLMPYRKISQSGVLFTALTNDIPVLVSNVGGLPDPLTVADVGWNIGAPTFDNLRNAMSELLSNPEEVITRKTNVEGFSKIRSHFDWHKISLNTFELYRKMCEESES